MKCPFFQPLYVMKLKTSKFKAYHYYLLSYLFTYCTYVNQRSVSTLSPTSPDKPQKNCTKKGMLFLASMGETGLYHDIFFLNSQLGLSRSNDNQPLNFEAGTSKYGNHSCKFGSSPRKGKVDMCPIFFQTRSAQTKWAELAVQFSWKLPVF